MTKSRTRSTKQPARSQGKTARATLKRRVLARKSTAGTERTSAKAKPSAWYVREKKLTEVFGPFVGKCAVAAAELNSEAASAAARLGLSVLQYGPKSDRMSWISVTHGLSMPSVHKGASSRFELILHWRQKDSKLPVRVLSQAAAHVLDNSAPLTPGELIISGEGSARSFGLSTLPHWIVCVSDKSTPAKLESDSGDVHFAVLVGITEGEMQCAMKVRSELADGRKVLFEALRLGQVYPVTDPDRTCMTRRRDFHRIWEAAFQHVKNAK
jgi:hypothetical protein